MKLTEEALNLLNNFKNKVNATTWIDHSICVGNTAGKIVEKLGIDVGKAKACGYIHDIGKGTAEFENHPMQGYMKVNVTIEKRLIDIYDRRGVHKNTVYNLRESLKLKKEFDEMLGYSVYKLFPEIIENL